jgi:hypothetical protein
MKKLFTILLAMAALTLANAQSSFQPLMKQLAPGQLEKLHYAESPLRGTTTTVMTINYDSIDRYYAAHHAGDSVFPASGTNMVSIWPVNADLDTSFYGCLKYAIQTYDTLVNVHNNFAAVNLANATIRVDSFVVMLSDSNSSGAMDTVTVSVFDETAATMTGSGLTGSINTTALWTQSFVDSANFFGPGSGQYVVLQPFYPNCTLPVGHTFGIRVDYKGNKNDMFYVAASYRNDCGTGTSDGLGNYNVTAPHNSSFYFNYSIISQVVDWQTNTAFPQFASNPSCDYLPIQNLYFYPSITVTSPNGIASIDAGISNFNVFPNPSNGIFNATIKLETASDVTTTVIDMIGNKVYESTDNSVTELNKQINLSSIAAGMYIVNVKTATGSVNQRIVIR